MPVISNPGSGPVAHAREPSALANIKAFVVDLNVGDVTVHRTAHDKKGDCDGRYCFTLARGKGRRKKCVEVEMPGLPLRRVRLTENDDAWQFPRLYVDGGSWLWPFAIEIARSCLGVE